MVAQARRVTCWTRRRGQPVKGSALDIFHPCGPPAADRETSAGWVAVASDRDMGNARWGPRPGRALAWLDSIFLARFARLGSGRFATRRASADSAVRYRGPPLRGQQWG